MHTIEIEKAPCGPVVSLNSIDLGAPPAPPVNAPSCFNNIPLEGVDPSSPGGAALFEIAAANRAIRRDRMSVATRIITSNGAPTRSKRVADNLSGKQQQRLQALLFHRPAGPAIVATLDEVLKALQKASKSASSLGFFGWAMDHFYHDSHRKRDPQSSLLYQVARLVLLVSKADLPEAVIYLLIPGTITALHKEDKETQPATAAAGLDAPLREIHSGSAFLKEGLRVMTRDNSFQRVKEELSIMQYGSPGQGARGTRLCGQHPGCYQSLLLALSPSPAGCD